MSRSKSDKFVGAIDQGTSSSRVLIFRVSDWKLITDKRVEFESEYPQEGWCEQDPMLILSSVTKTLCSAQQAFLSRGLAVDQVVSFGITNQRETTVVWDKKTGKPLYNALVWLDTRTKDIVDDLVEKFGQDYLKNKSGLPVSTYFSACKLKWLFENVPAVREAREKGTLMVGTVDTWLIWNLTGKQRYVTDVTNASRTMLMNISTLEWDEGLCDFFGLDVLSILPKIVPSSDESGYGKIKGPAFDGIRISGCLGDQQAALVGQHCFDEGTAKSTYGTGCFVLYNCGEKVVYSNNGLLSTVAYQFGKNSKPVYALEGSVSIAGAAVSWLKSIGIIDKYSDMDEHMRSVEDTGDVYFVPAFNGLFAPYWRPDARGTIVGITQYTNKGHICRATCEAVAFQVTDLLEGMQKDSGLKLESLAVDGGMTVNDVFMEIQASFLGITVLRPEMVETTALGAAIAAALGVEATTMENLRNPEDHFKMFFHARKEKEWKEKLRRWKMAVERSLGWEEKSKI